MSGGNRPCPSEYGLDKNISYLNFIMGPGMNHPGNRDSGILLDEHLAFIENANGLRLEDEESIPNIGRLQLR